MEQLINTIERRNFAGRDPQCKDGDWFIGCNIAQAEPDTEICKGKKGLRFVKCNLARAKVPKDSIIEGGNTSNEPLPSKEDEKAASIAAIDVQIADLESEKQKLEAQ